MNASVRLLLVALALVGAVIFASLIYRNTSQPPSGPAGETAAPEPVNEATLHPEFRAGLAALDEERNEDAARHFSAVPPEAPEYPTALQRLAVLQAKSGAVVEAQASMFRLLEMRPNDPEVHAVLGWLFYLAEDYDRAELAALRTLELDSEHLSTRYNVALYRVAQGRTQRAVSSYLRAMREDPSGREIAVHRERLRDYHDDHPESLSAHYALAFVANAMQDRVTETEELEHYIELAPEGPELEAARVKLREAREAVSGS